MRILRSQCPSLLNPWSSDTLDTGTLYVCVLNVTQYLRLNNGLSAIVTDLLIIFMHAYQPNRKQKTLLRHTQPRGS